MAKSSDYANSAANNAALKKNKSAISDKVSVQHLVETSAVSQRHDLDALNASATFKDFTNNGLAAADTAPGAKAPGLDQLFGDMTFRNAKAATPAHDFGDHGKARHGSVESDHTEARHGYDATGKLGSFVRLPAKGPLYVSPEMKQAAVTSFDPPPQQTRDITAVRLNGDYGTNFSVYEIAYSGVDNFRGIGTFQYDGASDIVTVTSNNTLASVINNVLFINDRNYFSYENLTVPLEISFAFYEKGNPQHVFQKIYTFTVLDLPEPPVNVAFSVAHIAENPGPNAIVGRLSAFSPEGKAITFVGGTDSAGGAFAVGQDAQGYYVYVADPTKVNFETFHSVNLALVAYTLSDVSANGRAETYQGVTITIDDVNEVPVIVNTGAVLDIYDNATAKPFYGVSFSDPEILVSDHFVVTVKLDDLLKGEFTQASWGAFGGSYNPLTGIYRVEGSLSEVTQSVKGLFFDPRDRPNAPVDSAEETYFTIAISDGFNPSTTSTVRFVSYEQNRAPQNLGFSTPAHVIENTSNQFSAIGTLSADDPNLPDLANLTYSINPAAGSNPNSYFVVDPNGMVHLAPGKSLNYEASDLNVSGSDKWYNLGVLVTDGHTGGTTSAVVRIYVDDVNEAPVNLAIAGGTAVTTAEFSTSIGGLTASDPDGASSIITWTVDSTNSTAIKAIFDVQQDAGGAWTLLARPNMLDYESASVDTSGRFYLVKLVATDNGSPLKSTTMTVRVNVTNVNEAPTAPATPGRSSIDESANAADGTLIVQISGSVDPDGTTPQYEFWQQGNGDAHHKFAITADGRISLAAGVKLNFEATDDPDLTPEGNLKFYTLYVVAKDGITSSAPTAVKVYVNDINERPTAPAVDFGNGAVSENETTARNLFIVKSFDADANDVVTYTFANGGNPSGKFAINGQTGQVSLLANANIDFESTSDPDLKTIDGTSLRYYLLKITATDRAGLPAVSDFFVFVSDEDESPILPVGQATWDENTGVGQVLATAHGIDPEGELVQYSLVTPSGKFWIDDTNGTITLATGETLNYEAPDLLWEAATQRKYYSIWVIAREDGGLGLESPAAEFKIYVTDVNERPTGVTYSTYQINENAQAGVTFANATFADPDSPAMNQGFRYELKDNLGNAADAQGRIGIDAISGSLKIGTAPLPDVAIGSTANLTVVVKITDQNGSGLSWFETVNITVNPVTPSNTAPDAPVVQGQVRELLENETGNAVVATVASIDAQNDAVTYSLVTNPSGKFEINALGEIRLKAGVNYEAASADDPDLQTSDAGTAAERKFYLVTVRATETASGHLASADTIVKVFLDDLNEAPTAVTFSRTTISEVLTKGAVVGQALVSDPDSIFMNGSFVYELIDSAGGRFALTSAGVLTVGNNGLPQVPTGQSVVLQIKVKVTDKGGGAGGLSHEEIVDITVNAGPNSAPEAPVLAAAPLVETAQSGALVGTLSAQDADGDVATYQFSHLVNGQIVLSDVSADGAFRIIGTSIFLEDPAKIQVPASGGDFTYDVMASDGLGGTVTGPVTVSVVNVNQAPVNLSIFDLELNPHGTITENATNPVAGTVSAIDPDTGGNLGLSYFIATNPGDKFTIDSVTGVLSLVGVADYEATHTQDPYLQTQQVGGVTKKFYWVEVGASDGLAVIKSTVQVFVNDVVGDPVIHGADNPSVRQVGDMQTIDLFRDMSVTADDQNLTVQVLLDWPGAGILIDTTGFCSAYDETNGTIFVTGNAARVTTALKGLLFSPADFANGAVNQLQGTTNFLVWVSDSNNAITLNTSISIETLTENRVPTELLLNGNLAVSVLENSTDFQGSLSAVDTNAGDVVTYLFAAGGNPDGIFVIEGSILKVAPGKNLNYEALPAGHKFYTVTVVASDGTGTTTQDFTINVLDDAEPNQAPTVDPVPATELFETQATGSTVLTLHPNDSDGDLVSFNFVWANGTLHLISEDNRYRIEGHDIVVADNLALQVELDETKTYTVRGNDGHATNGNVDATVTLTLKDTLTSNHVPSAPAIQPTSILETLSDHDFVATLQATDSDGNALTFTFVNALAGSNGLISADNRFEIVSGEIRVHSHDAIQVSGDQSFPYTITASDGNGGFTNGDITITVQDVVGPVNHAPDAPTMGVAAIWDTAAQGDFVGNLVSADQDAADTVTFTFEFAKAGSNGLISLDDRFKIEGGTIKVNGVLGVDTDTDIVYSVLASDGQLTTQADVTITVNNFVGGTNDAPAIALSGASTFATFDNAVVTPAPFAGVTITDDSATVTVVISFDTTKGAIVISTGVSGTTNAAGFYTITDTVANVNQAINQLHYDPNDRAADPIGSVQQTAFTIAVTDAGGISTTAAAIVTVDSEVANRAPTAVTFPAGAFINENCDFGTDVGTLGTTDANTGDTYLYELVNDAGGRFRLAPDTVDSSTIHIVTNKAIDYDTDPDLQVGTDATGNTIKWFEVTVKSTDRGGAADGLSVTTQHIRILVHDEAIDTQWNPTGITLANHTVHENLAGETVDTLQAIDRNGGDTFTYKVVSNAADPLSAHAHFKISADGTKLALADGFAADYEATDPLLQTGTNADGSTRKFYAVYVEVRDAANTANPAHVEKFEINVQNDANEGGTNSAPTNLRISTNWARELPTKDYVVGSLSADDIDNDTLVYELTDDAGGRFKLSGNSIMVKDSSLLDFEASPSHKIKVTVNDGHNPSVLQEFTVQLKDWLTESTAGTPGNDTFIGGKGADVFAGADGNDKITGGGGKDKLTGGNGNDIFYFDRAPTNVNQDTITDFNTTDDLIHIKNNVFGLGAATKGELAATRFTLGTVATDLNQRLIYDSTAGKFYLDADGNKVGGVAKVLVATFTNKPVLSHTDFWVV